jgi:sugar lactone lactonase YvrE
MGRKAIVVVIVSAMALLGAASASAADSVFWGNLETTYLSRASLAGGGGSDFTPAPGGAKYAAGIAADAATGKLYWVDAGTSTIRVANFDGSGETMLPTGTATLSEPWGLALDPAVGRLYWTNKGAEKISFANLDGSGGADLNTGAAPVHIPEGIAIDQAQNRVYWANYGPESIAYASLDGIGPSGELSIPGNLLKGLIGLAIEPIANRVYWSTVESGGTPPSIYSASLLEPAATAVRLPISQSMLSGSYGLAIDPAAGRLYWADEYTNRIVSSALDGSGATALVTTGATPLAPGFPALLKAPRAEVAPQLTTSALGLGSQLTCRAATWAADPLGTDLSWAPVSTALAWTLNGAPLATSANAVTITATQPGTYACQSSATNGAGTSTSASGPVTIASLAPAPTVVKLTRVKLDRHHGTATILAKVSGPGTLTLSGRKVVGRSVKASGAGIAKVKVAAKGGALKTLIRSRKVKVLVKLGFRATEGGRASVSKVITLHLARHHRHAR